MKTPKITLKQAEKAVKEHSFKICKEKGYSKKRVKKADKFEKKHGFRYEDVWNLDSTIACFILPRLVQLRDVHCGVPNYFVEQAGDSTEDNVIKKADKKWTKALNKMIYAFYLYITKDFNITDEEKAAIEEGFELFNRFFSSLWDQSKAQRHLWD